MAPLHTMIKRNSLEYLKQTVGWCLRGKDADGEWIAIRSYPKDWEPPIVDPNHDNDLLEEYDIYFI